MAQIILTTWPKKNGIPQRTALSWVFQKKLKAKKQKMKVAVQHVRSATGCVDDDENATVMGQGEKK